MAVYVDTSAWIALRERKDRDHEAAVGVLRGLSASGEMLVSGWHTLIELGDGLSKHYNQEVAATEIVRLIASPRLRTPPSEPHIESALRIMRENKSWGVDFSDCVSFAMMRSLRIRRAFTYDADFEKAGFEIVG